jgi:glucose/arabinose dehydrogenase
MMTSITRRIGAALTVSALGAVTCNAQTPLDTELVAGGFLRPVFAVHAPGDTDRLFVGEQHTGRIRILDLNTNTILATPFLDLPPVATGNEQGLLGMAFHWDYENNGYFYLNYTNTAGDTIIARFEVSAGDPNVADPGSQQIVMPIDQPFSNHNAGWLAFGPRDGYLYISTGDGGSGGDPGNRAQTITNQLLGKMLRVDVDGDDFPGSSTLNYAVPASNPLVGATGDDEIWAYGLRNPWRDAFDRFNGDLYIADVGQNAWEEVNVQNGDSAGGENYGWRCYEGNNAFNTTGCPPMSTLVFPVDTYSHGFGCSITGGEVYRGNAIPDLRGTYFYADVCSGRVWSFEYDGAGGITNKTDRTSELGGISSIASFGMDAEGEVYIVSLGGSVHRIVPDAPVTPSCYVDCDLSSGAGVLDIMDFLCFQDAFVSGFPYACNCDVSTGYATCDVFDFLCFQDAFTTGCP